MKLKVRKRVLAYGNWKVFGLFEGNEIQAVEVEDVKSETIYYLESVEDIDTTEVALPSEVREAILALFR